MIYISVPHNIASGKVLTSSSSVHNSPPEKAIDGKFNSGRMKPGGVCAHTKQEASWINIDLGTEHAISSIYLVGRGDTCDNCPAQSSGWTIRVGNTGTTTDPVCMENVNAYGGRPTPIQCVTKLSGSDVRIESETWMVLCEVLIFEEDAGLYS